MVFTCNKRQHKAVEKWPKWVSPPTVLLEPAEILRGEEVKKN